MVCVLIYWPVLRMQGTDRLYVKWNLAHMVQQGFLPLVLLTSKLDSSVTGAPHVH